MRLNVDSGYYSRRGTGGRFHGGIAGLRGLAEFPYHTRGMGVYVNPATGQVIPDDPAADAACAASGGTMDAYGNCVGPITSVITADEQNSYLSSPAYEATQGGTTPQESAAAAYADYCATSKNNALIFGTAVDPECTGSAPLNTGVTLAPGGFNALTASAPTGNANIPVAPPATNVLTAPAPGTTPATGGGTNQSGANSLTPGLIVNGAPVPASSSSTTPATCAGIGWGECLGPLDLGTWGLIAAGVLVMFMMSQKK